MDDIDTLSVKGLKELIARAGLEHGDCFEKADLRARAAEAVARLQACSAAQAEARGAIVSAPSEEDEPMIAPAAEPEEIDRGGDYSLDERADALLYECGLARGETVEDDVRALARTVGVDFVDTLTTLDEVERELMGETPAPRRAPRAQPPPAPALAAAVGPGALVPFGQDVYDREYALALVEDDVGDMSARELKSLVVHAGGALPRGAVEKPELRQLAAQAQLALKAEEAQDDDDSDIEMGETVSEEERKRRAKAAAEASGGVHDLAEDSDDSITDLTAVAPPAKKKARKDSKDSKDSKKGVKKPSKTNHLATLSSDRDQLLQRVLWHLECDYFMKPHQPEAVRIVAGLPKNWPRDDRNGDYTAADLQHLLVTAPAFTERGMLLADVMGLGKTVECLLGAALRKGVATAKKDPSKDLPTFIVAPNAAVLKQWREHLLNGIVEDEDAVFEYGRGAFFKRVELFNEKVKNGKAEYVLLTRFTLMSEIQSAADSYVDAQTPVVSPLFPGVGPLLADLMSVYRHGNGKSRRGEKNTLREKGEEPPDTARRLIAKHFFGPPKGPAAASSNAVINLADDEDVKDVKPKSESKMSGAKPTALTLLIDEAHFLRNAVSKWGLAAALAGHSALRCVCATGTPYNNGPKDMAALCSFWDARDPAATTKWWREVCEEQSDPAKRRAAQGMIAAWRPRHLVRRDKSTLAQQLPRRDVSEDVIAAASVEIYCYVPLQAASLELLQKFAKLGDTGQDKEQKRHLFQVLLSIWTLMRLCMIHPVLPRDGRELTKYFSPSRRKMKKVGKWDKTKCVVCYKSVSAAADDAAKNDVLGQGGDVKSAGGAKAAEDMAGGAKAAEVINLDADDADDADDDELAKKASSSKVPAGEPLVPCTNCLIPNSGHMIHACCASRLLPGAPCPRCLDLTRRAQMADGPLYCQKRLGGFRATRKLEAAVQKVRDAVADGSAVVFFSFFKGALDLAEGMLEGGEHGNPKLPAGAASRRAPGSRTSSLDARPGAASNAGVHAPLRRRHLGRRPQRRARTLPEEGRGRRAVMHRAFGRHGPQHHARQRRGVPGPLVQPPGARAGLRPRAPHWADQGRRRDVHGRAVHHRPVHEEGQRGQAQQLRGLPRGQDGARRGGERVHLQGRGRRDRQGAAPARGPAARHVPPQLQPRGPAGRRLSSGRRLRRRRLAASGPRAL